LCNAGWANHSIAAPAVLAGFILPPSTTDGCAGLFVVSVCAACAVFSDPSILPGKCVGRIRTHDLALARETRIHKAFNVRLARRLAAA
jgi:hypothetical protein